MKRNYLFLTILLVCSTTMIAQVTIGSSEEPVKGALLDLKEDGTTSKGLGLPRVALQAYNKVKMGADAPEYTDKENHMGLVVYNVNPDYNQCDTASIPPGLHIWDGQKWVGIGTPEHESPTPPNLPASLFNPNSYMVTTVGSASSITIPVAKAFAVWDFWTSEEGGKRLADIPFSGSLSTSVVWQEALDGGNNSIVGTPVLSTTNLDKNATITIPTTGNVGNALVSVSDAVGVRWSWHIWVTETPATNSYNGYVWMDRNLGATSATPGNNGTLGLYYQWGRNTPIPGYTKFSGSDNKTTVPVQFAEVSDVVTNDGNNPAKQNSLSYAIMHPLTFISSNNSPSDWYSTSTTVDWATRWAEQVQDSNCPAVSYSIASITNPCPEGWKVPEASNNTTSPWNGIDNATNKVWTNGYNWIDPAAGYYPAAGYRNGGSNALVLINSSGWYWTASYDSDSSPRALRMLSSVVNPWYRSNPAYSYSVRCVQK